MWLIWGVCLAGCASQASSNDADLSTDSLYAWGDGRDQLETRYGAGAFYWIVNEVPADDFAAAIIKSMVSQRKPRPASYEVFLHHHPGGANTRDYVFFSDSSRVLYSARYIPKSTG